MSLSFIKISSGILCYLKPFLTIEKAFNISSSVSLGVLSASLLPIDYS